MPAGVDLPVGVHLWLPVRAVVAAPFLENRSFVVEGGRHGLGVRAALGARPRALLAAGLRDNAPWALAGIPLGLIPAYWAGIRLPPLVLETAPVAFHHLLVTASVPRGVAIASCYRPVRRASRVDPVQALRPG